MAPSGQDGIPVLAYCNTLEAFCKQLPSCFTTEFQKVDFKSFFTRACILQPGSKPKPYRIALEAFWKSWPAHPKPNWKKLISKAS